MEYSAEDNSISVFIKLSNHVIYALLSRSLPSVKQKEVYPKHIIITASITANNV